MEKTEAKLELIKRHFGQLDAKQLEQYSALDGLYREWNSRINVISRKDINHLYENHILHSLSIAAAFQFRNNDEVIDIGTGGGFPGIPLAIFFPDTQFHLVDSIGKKIKVVNAIAGAIGLQNITTAHIRAEKIKGRQFSAAVSRAVAPLGQLWAWARPLIRKSTGEIHSGLENPDGGALAYQRPIPNGLICLKGGELAPEIAASGTRPTILEIHQFFKESFFLEKFIIYLPKQGK